MILTRGAAPAQSGYRCAEKIMPGIDIREA
jgi:hypothetical protein